MVEKLPQLFLVFVKTHHGASLKLMVSEPHSVNSQTGTIVVQKKDASFKTAAIRK